jgi:predicted aspartyl protease
MMQGYIDDLGYPRVNVAVTGARRSVTLPALVDTGFDGDLSLPIRIAVDLGLELIASFSIELADGTVREDQPVFSGIGSLGDGRPREIEIVLTGCEEALVGLNWFRESSLCMNFKKRELTFEEIPAEPTW